MSTSPPTSVRLPASLRDEIRERARTGRRSFSNQLIVLLEAAVAEQDASDGIDPDEVERLADIAREALHGG
jgi:Arc/MetJ-type ribon-helix-helix transcriptional regulator